VLTGADPPHDECLAAVTAGMQVKIRDESGGKIKENLEIAASQRPPNAEGGGNGRGVG